MVPKRTGAKTDSKTQVPKRTGAETALPLTLQYYPDDTMANMTSQEDLNKIPDIHFNLKHLIMMKRTLCSPGAKTDLLVYNGAETELPVIGSVFLHCDVTKLTVTSQNH